MSHLHCANIPLLGEGRPSGCMCLRLLSNVMCLFCLQRLLLACLFIDTALSLSSLRTPLQPINCQAGGRHAWGGLRPLSGRLRGGDASQEEAIGRLRDAERSQSSGAGKIGRLRGEGSRNESIRRGALSNVDETGDVFCLDLVGQDCRGESVREAITEATKGGADNQAGDVLSVGRLRGGQPEDKCEAAKDIRKPDVDKREYRHVTLENRLEVVLVSDAETHSGAAALCVAVGQLDDPPEVQGLAHFLEHMLFRKCDPASLSRSLPYSFLVPRCMCGCFVAAFVEAFVVDFLFNMSAAITLVISTFDSLIPSSKIDVELLFGW